VEFKHASSRKTGSFASLWIQKLNWWHYFILPCAHQHNFNLKVFKFNFDFWTKSRRVNFTVNRHDEVLKNERICGHRDCYHKINFDTEQDPSLLWASSTWELIEPQLIILTTAFIQTVRFKVINYTLDLPLEFSWFPNCTSIHQSTPSTANCNKVIHFPSPMLLSSQNLWTSTVINLPSDRLERPRGRTMGGDC